MLPWVITLLNAADMPITNYQEAHGVTAFCKLCADLVKAVSVNQAANNRQDDHNRNLCLVAHIQRLNKEQGNERLRQEQQDDCHSAGLQLGFLDLHVSILRVIIPLGSCHKRFAGILGDAVCIPKNG